MKISKEDLLKLLHESPPVAKPVPKIQSNDLKLDAFGNIHMTWAELEKQSIQNVASMFQINSLYENKPFFYKNHPIIITGFDS